MRTATELSRKVRVPGYRAPGPTSEPPPAYLSVPVTVARKAVSLYHEEGAPAARSYLLSSKVGQWANHINASMATSNSNVLSGFEAYITADTTDGRLVAELARSTVLTWPAGPLKVRLDVILTDRDGIAARVLFWDGPDLTEAHASLIAAPYAVALAQLHPEASLTAIGVWQGRRQTYIEVPIGALCVKFEPLSDFSSASSWLAANRLQVHLGHIVGPNPLPLASAPSSFHSGGASLCKPIESVPIDDRLGRG